MVTSEKVRRARAMFGLGPRAGRVRRVAAAARMLDALLGAGEVALIVGPSGSGKSTLGRALATRCGCGVVGSADVRGHASDARVLDLFESGLEGAMACLARAGLGEARVMVARAGELSDGQRARLAIALAMEKANGTLILDEFASVLDRPAAAGLCRTLRKWASASGVRVVCITAHEDVLEWLGPAVLAVVGERVVVRRRA